MKTQVKKGILVFELFIVLFIVVPSVLADSPRFGPGDIVKAKGVSFYDPACSVADVGLRGCLAIYGDARTEVVGEISPKPGVKGTWAYYRYGKYRIQRPDGFVSWYPAKQLTMIRRVRWPLVLKKK